MKKLLLFLAITLVGCAFTPNPIPPNLIGEDRAIYVAKECKDTIRANNNLKQIRSDFDAYYSNRTFHYFGSDSERFQFQKCLKEFGF